MITTYDSNLFLEVFNFAIKTGPKIRFSYLEILLRLEENQLDVLQTFENYLS